VTKESLWIQLRGSIVSDPWRGLALLALMASAELLIPAELFYRTLGTTPTAAGIGGLDVLLQQSALVLVMYAAVGAAWAVTVFVMMYPFAVAGFTVRKAREKSSVAVRLISVVPTILGIALFVISSREPLGFKESSLEIAAGALLFVGLFMPWIAFRKAKEERREAHREMMDVRGAVAIGGVWFGAAMLLFISIATAVPYANEVKSGGAPNDLFFPWQARHVTVRWTGDDTPFRLPSCRELIYLGEGNDRVLLYDSDVGRTMRLTSKSVELSFPDSC
jgi:hypothetical protein